MRSFMPVLTAGFICCSAAFHASAQIINGSGASVDARCGGSEYGHHYHLNEAAAISRHGECPGPGGQGLASINDAVTSWVIGTGGFQFEAYSSTDFFGTHADAGTALAINDIEIVANDVVFTNIANPAQTGAITIGGVHYLSGGIATTGGLSNCDPFRPSALISFSMGVGPCHANGSRKVEPDLPGGVSIEGVFVGDPNDGTLTPHLTAGGGISLTTPNTFDLIIGARGDVVDCDFPPAEVQTAHAFIRWTLPCGEPVFDLPPGITVNSAQLGIVDNIRVGASISAQPADSSTCRNGGAASFSVGVVSADPVGYRWQWRRVGQPSWIDVLTGANDDGDISFNAFSDAAAQLDLAAYHDPGAAQTEFRCVVVSTCGDIPTSAATLSICAADIVCDGAADIDDLFAVINAWGPCADPDDCPADIAPAGGDDLVDIDDLFAVINAWGSCQ